MVNLVCKPGNSKSSKVDRIKGNFISERLISIWNKLPIEVKTASSLTVFKSNLETYKSKSRAIGISSSRFYWGISEKVLFELKVGVSSGTR